MDFQKDFSLEYAILRFDVKPLHIYIQLPGEYFRDLMHYAQVIYPFHVNCCGEKQLLMSIPICSQNVIAVTCFKFVCNGALTFVDSYAVFFVNITQDIITRDWTAVLTDNIMPDCLLVQEKRFFAVHDRSGF